jgi:biofilm protein TabA
MILDDINNHKRYINNHPLFQQAFDFLVHTNFETLENGKHEINSDNMFAIVSRNGNSISEDSKMESHRKYIDIHFVVKGSDRIGWKSISDCKGSIGTFNVEDDYILYQEADYLSFNVTENKFLVVYPEDVHAPLLETKDLFKVVLKIKL